MEKVTSADGTAIAFDRLGAGMPVVIAGGALCTRAATRPLAEHLAQQFTVFNYDRRGRGDSGDDAPYAVEREIEDLAALLAAAGGSASVYGHSSAAGLALRGAAHGLPVARLVLHDPPYVPMGEGSRRRSREFAADLRAILAEGRGGDAVELFLTTIGMPSKMVAAMSRDSDIRAIAPTLEYDLEVVGISNGGTIPTDLVGVVTVPTLVLCGGANTARTIDISRQIAGALPNGRLGVLEGVHHIVAPEVLAPVLANFFADR